jgi:hypothetical protein
MSMPTFKEELRSFLFEQQDEPIPVPYKDIEICNQILMRKLQEAQL